MPFLFTLSVIFETFYNACQHYGGTAMKLCRLLRFATFIDFVSL